MAATEITSESQASVQADARREYLGGGYPSWSNGYRTLPWWFDDLTRDLGDDIYDRMLLDPQVSKCVNLLKIAALTQGLRATPSIKKGADGYERAVEIADFVQWNIDQLFDPEADSVSLYWQLWDLLDAIAFGSRLAEQVYVVAEEGRYKNSLVLKSLKVKPRCAYAFVVDRYVNVLGVVTAQPVKGDTVTAMPLLAGSPISVGQTQTILPRRKFCVLTMRPKNSDPRGSSLIRPAYNPWWCKVQNWPEYLKYLAQFANPSLVGKTAENAQPVQLFEADGVTPKIDEFNNPVTLSPERSMLEALIQLRGGSVAAFPFGSEVDPLQMQGEGGVFTAANATFNREITLSILLQTLATEEGEHQARAAATTHQDALGVVIQHVKDALARAFRQDVVRNLVELNYGREALSLCPLITLSRVEHQDFAATASAIAKLDTSGFLHPSQYAGLDDLLQLPPRSAEAILQAEDLYKQGGKPQAPTGRKDAQVEPEGEQ